MFLKNVFSKICGPYKFIFTFTNIYITKLMPLFILAVLPGNWIVHCTFLSSLVYIRLIFVQFSLFLYSSVSKSVWKPHPYENSLIPTLVWWYPIFNKNISMKLRYEVLSNLKIMNYILSFVFLFCHQLFIFVISIDGTWQKKVFWWTVFCFLPEEKELRWLLSNNNTRSIKDGW